MTVKRTMLAVAAILFTGTAQALAESDSAAYARGKTLVDQGDFEGALEAYATAVRADPGKAAYAERYSLVRRIVQLRRAMATQTDSVRWTYAARALNSLYCSQGMLEKALALGQAVHARLNDATSATMLAETQLALNRNAEAAAMLSALDAKAVTPATQALLGIALARQGKTAEARRVAQQVTLGAEDPPQLHYTVARLHAATGEKQRATAALVRSFQNTPPSVLDTYREHARRCPDFAVIASTQDFAKALATESKIPQSACSGGSGCAGCPMRGQCAKSPAQQP